MSTIGRGVTLSHLMSALACRSSARTELPSIFESSPKRLIQWYKICPAAERSSSRLSRSIAGRRRVTSTARLDSCASRKSWENGDVLPAYPCTTIRRTHHPSREYRSCRRAACSMMKIICHRPLRTSQSCPSETLSPSTLLLEKAP
jgi:hypothetical protein